MIGCCNLYGNLAETLLQTETESNNFLVTDLRVSRVTTRVLLSSQSALLYNIITVVCCDSYNLFSLYSSLTNIILIYISQDPGYFSTLTYL